MNLVKFHIPNVLQMFGFMRGGFGREGRFPFPSTNYIYKNSLPILKI
jgi:hypothetical protein